MEDVTATIFSALFLASFVVDHLATSRRQTKVASALLLIAAALTLWTHVYFPISNAAGNTLSFMVMAAWLGFVALVTPKWLREARAAAREQKHRMASLWQEFVDTVDAQISVDNGMFYNDLRALMFWPLLPFIIATPFVAGNQLVGWLMVAGMVLIEAPWVIFLFRRRAAKKRSRIEPTRFSDVDNGYQATHPP